MYNSPYISFKNEIFYETMKKEAGREVIVSNKKMRRCNECEYWERDPLPYNGIYFGICRMDGKIKYEFHLCDFKDII